MNRELIIIIVSIGMVLFFYLIQDNSTPPQPGTLGDKSSGPSLPAPVEPWYEQFPTSLHYKIQTKFLAKIRIECM